MPLPARSLPVVGTDHPNKRGPTRRFEIKLCLPGEPIQLIPEPTNPADPNAVMVVTARGIHIGYLRAEHASWFSAAIRSGRIIEAIFQEATKWGAAIRVAFDGEAPTLPVVAPRIAGVAEIVSEAVDESPGFYPDEEWPD